MGILSLIILAIGLTFDTFAVSVSIGLIVNHIQFKAATRIALCMAFFQALMPFIGWAIGYSIRNLIASYDHWIALILLSALGIKMIVEGLKQEDDRKPIDPFKLTVLITISLATSIDALVVGIPLGFSDVNIGLAVAIIGFFTYLVAMLGILFGKKAGSLLGHRMEIFGGLMLIGIGVKIVLEHLQLL
jgi:putative Mn2+ efflux pump MntP